MKTLLASVFVSLSLLLASCGTSAGAESFSKTIMNEVSEVTTKFEGVKDADSAKAAVSMAETALPLAKTAFEGLSKLGSKADASDAVKKMLTDATSKFGGLKTMLEGLKGKFASMPDVAKMMSEKLPALLKMLPKMGG